MDAEDTDSTGEIGGLFSIYTLLGTRDAEHGQPVKYSRWADPVGAVTFASVVFS